MKFLTLGFLVLFASLTPNVVHANEYLDWQILQEGADFSHDTSTGVSERKGVSRENLISVSRHGENVLQSYWEEGAFRATVMYNDRKIVDGFDNSDVSRINSFRFDKTGSTAYIRTTKGPQAIVEFYQDGRPILSWPRLSLVNILAYRKDKAIVSVYVDKSQTTEFWRFSRNRDGSLAKTGERIGALAGCSVLSSKVIKTGIAIAAYCHPDRGSDVKFLEFNTGKISDIRATEDDELLAYSWAEYDKKTIPILSISGNSNARQLFHATTGSLLSLLGEPMSVSSDESGKQSWSQSYRTRTLAELYRKTQHPVFSALATRAMSNTLNQTNQSLNITGDFNPLVAWASRIYSADGQTPISFMINQAMISSSLIASCRSLGQACPPDLKQRVDQNARQLVTAYEKWYDEASNLYRIPYEANFRFDGIWAPWNWHMMWLPVLQHVGQISENELLVARAERIADAFVKSWEIGSSDHSVALWRYWPEPYYQGWKKTDNISLSRPTQKPRDMTKERYEDINHAGISLLGLSDMNHRFSPLQMQSVQRTLQSLLQQSPFLARDLNGNGPVSPRWLPGAGWHLFGSKNLQDFYGKKLPGSVSSDQHLAYASLYNPDEGFFLKLSLLECINGKCSKKQSWSSKTAGEFIRKNPLFKLMPVRKLNRLQRQ